MASTQAGDFDYDAAAGGRGYAALRRADPRVAAVIHRQLGAARTVINVGAGAGSYEPEDRHVVAVEPSAAMRAQRPRRLAPAVHAVAEQLPFDDGAFDAGMAISTVHQWKDMAGGLRELCRVTRGPVVVLIFDPEMADRFWVAAYVPELAAAQKRRDPTVEVVRRHLLNAGCAETSVVSVPLAPDCTDGFIDAYFARPEQLLDPEVRRWQSMWAFIEPAAQERFVRALRADLESGEWDRKHGRYRQMAAYDGSVRLVVGRPAS